MLDGHGDDLYRYDGRIRHNFSTNIIGNIDHSGLLDHLNREMRKIGSYPEPHPFSLEARIAHHLRCDPEKVVVTNGATDAIYRIAHIYSGKRSAVCRPTFREYQDACALHRHDISFFDDLESIPENVEIVWICNPNNPTGKVWPKEGLLKAAADKPETLFVIDQAYASYTSLPVISVDEGISARNIVLLNSMTKMFSVPGLRIGYLTASDSFCRDIRTHGIPWAVNSLAISAAEYLLDHSEKYDIPVCHLHHEALRVAKELRNYGIQCTETDCNFLLCSLPNGMVASNLKEFLANENGILIRDASNFEGLDSGYFRIAMQTVEENNLLIKAIKEWITG